MRNSTGAPESLCVHSAPAAWATPLASGTAGKNCARPTAVHVRAGGVDLRAERYQPSKDNP